VTITETTILHRPPTWLPGADEGTVCRLVQDVVAACFAVSPEQMCARSRGRASAAFARQVAMYLTHVVLGLNYSAAGRMFHRDRTTVAHACRVVEDRRDNPRTDALLQALEDVLGAFTRTRLLR
jgi:chromosomal replication initiation ATPase DnaA